MKVEYRQFTCPMCPRQCMIFIGESNPDRDLKPCGCPVYSHEAYWEPTGKLSIDTGE